MVRNYEASSSLIRRIYFKKAFFSCSREACLSFSKLILLLTAASQAPRSCNSSCAYNNASLILIYIPLLLLLILVVVVVVEVEVFIFVVFIELVATVLVTPSPFESSRSLSCFISDLIMLSAFFLIVSISSRRALSYFSYNIMARRALPYTHTSFPLCGKMAIWPNSKCLLYNSLREVTRATCADLSIS